LSSYWQKGVKVFEKLSLWYRLTTFYETVSISSLDGHMSLRKTGFLALRTCPIGLTQSQNQYRIFQLGQKALKRGGEAKLFDLGKWMNSSFKVSI
jgi:hypothetical protein